LINHSRNGFLKHLRCHCKNSNDKGVLLQIFHFVYDHLGSHRRRKTVLRFGLAVAERLFPRVGFKAILGVATDSRSPIHSGGE
jgi:hypothetical protein